jgi:hypothetical protein
MVKAMTMMAVGSGPDCGVHVGCWRDSVEKRSLALGVGGADQRGEDFRGVEMACEEVNVPLSLISVFGEGR